MLIRRDDIDRFNSEGYLIRNLFSAEQCDSIIKEFTSTVVDIKRRCREDFAENVKKTFFCGDVVAFGLPHTNGAWEIRKRAAELARELMNESDIVCSVEGWMYYRDVFQRNKLYGRLFEPDAQRTGRLKCVVMLSRNVYPANGGIFLQRVDENCLSYVTLQAGDVLFWQPDRYMYKFKSPDFVKQEGKQCVNSELCMLPVTFDLASRLSMRLVTQRMSCCASYRATLSNVLEVKRRTLFSQVCEWYEQKYLAPKTLVSVEEVRRMYPPTTLGDIKLDNFGKLYWFFADEQIKRLVQGDHYNDV
jgi:hypothetical protein